MLHLSELRILVKMCSLPLVFTSSGWRQTDSTRSERLCFLSELSLESLGGQVYRDSVILVISLAMLLVTLAK
jgi:hypothetical protein